MPRCSCVRVGLRDQYTAFVIDSIIHRPPIRRRRSSVNFRGYRIFVRKICIKDQQNALILHDSCPKNYQSNRIFMTFARKIYKISEFYMIFARKMPEFYIIIARKIFSQILGGGGTCPAPAPRLLRLFSSWNPIVGLCLHASNSSSTAAATTAAATAEAVRLPQAVAISYWMNRSGTRAYLSTDAVLYSHAYRCHIVSADVLVDRTTSCQSRISNIRPWKFTHSLS